MSTKKVISRKECVTVILNFLAWKDYHPCSEKDLLKSPPLNVLLNIWNFLFRLIDSNVNITKENMAVEVPKFYNEFGYPHTMKTSHLRTPTADHQWESNLVALTWLCKLLLYEHQNFDKEFENKTMLRQTDSYMFNVASKMNIKNTLTSMTITELTNKHFQFYIKSEETGKSIANDVDAKLNNMIAKLQSSVDSKKSELETLRSSSVKMQNDIEEFDKLKERVSTLSLELSQIETLTENIKDYCTRLKRELDSSKHILNEETNYLLELESKNKEINDMMKTRIDGNDIRGLNIAINELKISLSNSVKNIKDLEMEIPTLSSNVTNTKHNLAKSLSSVSLFNLIPSQVSKTYQLIMNSLSTHGIDVSYWKKLDRLLKSVDEHSVDKLLSITDNCLKIVDEALVSETLTFKNESEVKIQHNETLSDLEKSEKLLKEEIAELQAKESEYFKSSLFNKEKSQIISETDYIVSIIKSTAKDEMVFKLIISLLFQENSKRELENATNDLQQAHKRLSEEKFQAKSNLNRYLNNIKELVEKVEDYKSRNCNMMKELV
ncbi:conserved hypothetical protein [Theileria orientalis strain Shintoku]|uniref:Kinetochore protein NDC80 n=1 Tax=Theileria orientalis strain Shintoku TaxID=869250 RepID=J7M8C9_THEOR|nr:conserved hypothetical protein [Theileria orientalis strain Shintoku]PVC54302.1 hypothetical protein MACL_00003177 [Theileria orientalis]BAM38723.1 conserved hypothetical protein [Theileria orientalis strain Shintoku]|eukprot:XP_009689024.1 conserved hypothetical protein [Theileria orientalis strain Shintoku]